MSGAGPASTRFRKGQSGNPGGRPRKQLASRASAFDVVIDRTLTVVQDGRSREVTVDEALQHKTYLDALAGNRAARRQILRMIAKREEAITKSVPQKPSINVLWEPPAPRNTDEALLILGIAARDPHPEGRGITGPESLLLEPWAVEAALARRGARRLGKQEIEEARGCTRAANGLRWPRPVEP